MKELLFAVLFLTAAFAVKIDNNTGCEIYADHLVCPQESDVNTYVRYTSDTTCFSMQNEYGNMEDIGCSAYAELTSQLEYQSCKAYIPFNTDVIIEEIDYNYQCTTEKILPGEQITVLGFQDQYSDCTVIEDDGFMIEYSCPTNNQVYAINGGMIYYDGIYSLFVYNQTPPAPMFGLTESLSTPLILLGISVLAIYAWHIWTQQKNKER